MGDHHTMGKYLHPMYKIGINIVENFKHFNFLIIPSQSLAFFCAFLVY